MLVQDILDRKGGQVYEVGCDAPIGKAVAMLAAWNVGVVLVTDPKNGLVGIISERDLVRALSQFGGSFLRMRANELMTRRVITCKPETTVANSLALMGLHRVRHLPVVRDGRIQGVISIRDLIRARFDLWATNQHAAAPEDSEEEAAREIAAFQQKNRVNTETIANISCELRTPLTTVIGFSEIIAGGLLGPNAASLYREYAAHINTAGQHLLKMVDEMLELARANAILFGLEDPGEESGEEIAALAHEGSGD